mmetsp:Transcript_13868/g.27695  ORF Transcript_13868/g.27695 Transcript_13868/m.27695 type:complete len:86 (+) Transcript_13868:440-697(+)
MDTRAQSVKRDRHAARRPLTEGVPGASFPPCFPSFCVTWYASSLFLFASSDQLVPSCLTHRQRDKQTDNQTNRQETQIDRQKDRK